MKNKKLHDNYRSLSLKRFFITVGELLLLLTLHPKLIFPIALKKALMVPEYRSYQIQYSAKIFPSPLASTLRIHFYLHLKESSDKMLWIAIAVKSATFLMPPKVHPKLLPKLRILFSFSTTWLKIWRKSWWLCLFWWNRSILHIFCFYWMVQLLLLGKFRSHAWLEKNCVYEASPLFFPRKTSDYSYLLRIFARVDFFSNVFRKP